MLEATLVIAAVGSVGLIVLLATLPTAPVLILGAIGVLVLGLVVGVATGFWYHVVLYRIMSSKVGERIPPRQWRPVTPAMAAGMTDRVWTTAELLGYRVPATILEKLADLEDVFPTPDSVHHVN